MNPLKAVIRSRGRAEILRQTAAELLWKTKIFDKVYVCVTETDPQKELYEILCKDFGFELLISPAGNLCDKNNFLLSLWPESGDLVILIEDTLTEFLEFPAGNKRFQKIQDGGKQIRKTLLSARRQGLLKGVYGVAGKQTGGLYFIRPESYKAEIKFHQSKGPFRGWICKTPKDRLQKVQSKILFQEDVEMGVQFLIRDGASVLLSGFRADYLGSGAGVSQRKQDMADYAGKASNIPESLRTGDPLADRVSLTNKDNDSLIENYPLFLRKGPGLYKGAPKKYRTKFSPVARASAKKLLGVSPNQIYSMNKSLSQKLKQEGSRDEKANG